MSRADVNQPAGLPDIAEVLGQAEQPQPELEEDVIIDHGAAPPAHRFDTTSMG